MSSFNVENLFDSHRFAVDGVNIIPLVLYFPLGLVLSILRLFVFLHALLVYCILPQRSSICNVILRVMLAVVGILITTEGEEGYDPRARVLVANHVSTLDHFVSNIALPHFLPTHSSGPSWVHWVLNLKTFAAHLSKEEFILFVRKLCQESTLPLLIFPEKILTNGRQGLLKFSDVPFRLNCSIQPIGIQTRRHGIFPVNVSTSSSVWWTDLFWCFFIPVTIFKIKILPVTQKKDSESEEEFCERVRGNMAKSLSLQITDLSAGDVLDQRKRKQTSSHLYCPAQSDVESDQKNGRPSLERNYNSDLLDPEVRQLVLQVQEVLTHVSTEVILRDILVTRDVDQTITNILEGKESVGKQSSVEEKPSNSKARSPTQLKVTTFGKSSQERQLSFQERKNVMIEEARKRYLEKHGSSQ